MGGKSRNAAGRVSRSEGGLDLSHDVGQGLSHVGDSLRVPPTHCLLGGLLRLPRDGERLRLRTLVIIALPVLVLVLIFVLNLLYILARGDLFRIIASASGSSARPCRSGRGGSGRGGCCGGPSRGGLLLERPSGGGLHRRRSCRRPRPTGRRSSSRLGLPRGRGHLFCLIFIFILILILALLRVLVFVLLGVFIIRGRGRGRLGSGP